MIELPRAALNAKNIAKHADFFSFGTNDLTQTTLGISRDDSGKFLDDYVENKIFKIDRTNLMQYIQASDYGISLGIPEYQVNFIPEVDNLIRNS